MTALQIVLLSFIGICTLLSIVFMIMFIVEISVEPKEDEVKNIYVTQNITTSEENVDDMLASLDEKAKDEDAENSAEEKVEEQPEEVSETVEEEKEEVVETVQEEKEEVKEEPKEEVVETVQEVQETEVQNEEVAEEEKSEETEEVSDEELEYKGEPHEAIVPGTVIDYKARLEKIIASRDKIERDLTKIQKSILKYERTKRRMNRNQKMLDRRAGELTNLNLVMYSVTYIKNVDEDKKAKQEELTAHIAELKASIQDAEEFIESNKEKNDHNVKMAKFLLNEKNRYNEEIAELEDLIKKSEDAE